MLFFQFSEMADSVGKAKLDLQLTIKVLRNINSVLNISKDFDSIVNKWYEEQVALEKKSPSTPNRKKLNINDIIWLLGKKNVDLNLHIDLIDNNKETENYEDGSRVHKEEYPKTFMGINLNMFKSDNFKPHKAGKNGESKEYFAKNSRKDVGEAILDAVNEHEKKQRKAKPTNEKKPQHFNFNVPINGLEEMDPFFRQEMKTKEQNEAPRCINAKRNNIDKANKDKSWTSEDVNENRSNIKGKPNRSAKESSLESMRQNPTYIKVDEKGEGPGNIFANLLGAVKYLPLGNVGLNLFQDVKIPPTKHKVQNLKDGLKSQDKSGDMESKEQGAVNDASPEGGKSFTATKEKEESGKGNHDEL